MLLVSLGRNQQARLTTKDCTAVGTGVCMRSSPECRAQSLHASEETATDDRSPCEHPRRAPCGGTFQSSGSTMGTVGTERVPSKY